MKLVVYEQLRHLDILCKFPSIGTSEKIFDENRKEEIRPMKYVLLTRTKKPRG